MTHLSRQQPTELYCFANRLERIPVLRPVLAHGVAELVGCRDEYRLLSTVQSKSSVVPVGFARRPPFVDHNGKANGPLRRCQRAMRGVGPGNDDHRGKNRGNVNGGAH